MEVNSTSGNQFSKVLQPKTEVKSSNNNQVAPKESTSSKSITDTVDISQAGKSKLSGGEKDADIDIKSGITKKE